MSFDRKTFNPYTNSADREALNRLRRVGRSRAWVWAGRHYDRAFKSNRYFAMSTAMREAHDMFDTAERVLDIGCGDSPDMAIARNWWEIKSFSVDLFPPFKDELRENFAQADVVEGLPFIDGSFDHVIAQAVMDLVKPEERKKVYEEVFRVLADWGTFTINFVSLKLGWGFNIKKEIETLLDVGFNRSGSTMFIKSDFDRRREYRAGDRVISTKPDPLYKFGTVVGTHSYEMDAIKVRVDGSPHAAPYYADEWRVIQPVQIPALRACRGEG